MCLVVLFHFLVLLLSFRSVRRTCLISARRYTRSRMRACVPLRLCAIRVCTMVLKSIEWHYRVMLFQLIRFSIARQAIENNQQPNRTKDRQTSRHTKKERVAQSDEVKRLWFTHVPHSYKSSNSKDTRTSKVRKEKRSEHSIYICTLHSCL